MKISEEFVAQCRCVVLMVIGFLVLCSVYNYQNNPSGVQTRKRPPAGLVWMDAAHYAKDSNDIDLLIAFVRSKAPDARRCAAYLLRDAELSEKTITVWGEEVNDSDKQLQSEGMISLWSAAMHLGYDHKTLPPLKGSPPFAEQHEHCVSLWRSWWEANKEEMLSKVKAKEDSESGTK